ncbi:MAG: acylphosphatase [Planctomycetota bacterium]|nr:acylphosphatase [Planctomycetota bacterium]
MVGSSRHERWNIHFTGHVQGVGFRYNTRRLADDVPVTGFVRNLSDGRVEVVAEGATTDLDSFRAKIEHAMSGHIQEILIDRGLVTGEFSSFEIRF